MLLGFLFFISFSSSKLPELLAEISGLTVRIDSPQHQQLLVHYCTFTEFKFENDYGGAIYTYFKTQELTIIDCIFNTVGSRQNGGGIFADIHILTVENSTFETCYAFESNGGGIYCNATTASFSNIYFMNCYTKKDGGAIWVNVTDTITLNNCSFNECYTTDTSGLGAGGGIFVTSASSLIFNSNCSFNKNRAQNGAAIYFQACQNVEINDEIIFSENHAVINGGIMHFENDVESISIVPLFDIIVPDGTTMANLFYFYQTVKKVVIENIKIETEYSKFPTLFYFNGAVEKATIKQLTVSGIVSQTGFIHFNSDVSDVTFENCNFANGSCKNGIVYIQSAENVSFVDCNFEGNTVEVSGGAICIVLCQNFAMESCIFINNTATNGGALYLGCTGSSDVTGINIFQGNRAQIGGAIYIEDTPSVLDFSACYLDASNSALYNAELIFFKKVAHTVILANFDCVISDATQNAVAQFDGPSVDVIEMRNCTCSQSTAGHAAIRFFEGRCYKMLLFDCIFEDNTCSTTGGAIYAENCLHAEFHRCTFNRNVATNGGGVCYLIAIQYLELEDCTFINNSASHGGCFIISNPVTKFHGSNYFSGNIARTTHAGVFWVAGEIDTINIEYPAMILEGDNQATQVGCLFFFDQKINHVNIIGINYTSHTTTNRAAFYFQVSPVTAYIKNVTMSNIDQDSGIRFVNVDDTLTIENCTFINNKATASPTTNGGAIALGIVQHIYVIESIFINNSCSGSGGALYIDSPDCIITGRCVFDGNVAAYDGGCISFASVQTTIDFSDSYVGPNNQASRYSGLFYFSNHVTEAIFKNISWEPLQINPIGAIKFNDGVDKLYLENIAIFNSSKEIVPIYTKGNLIEYVSINTTYEGCHGTEPFINVPDADLVNISSCKFIRNSATSNFLVYAKCQRLLTSGKLVFDSNTVANNAESSVIYFEPTNNIVPIKLILDVNGISTRLLKVKGKANQIMIHHSDFENLAISGALFDIEDATLRISNSYFHSATPLTANLIQVINKQNTRYIHCYIVDSTFRGFQAQCILRTDANFTSIYNCVFEDISSQIFNIQEANDVLLHNISVSNFQATSTTSLAELNHIQNLVILGSKFQNSEFSLKTGFITIDSCVKIRIADCDFEKINTHDSLMILVQNFAELEVIQTNFNECSSTISGQSGSLVTIDDTDITGCSCKSGFVLSLTSIQNTIQLLGVKYENNNAIIGIIIAYSSANVEIDNVNCSHSSSSYAGGITIENVTGNVLVTNSKFTDCHSDSIAGGICIKNVSTLTVTFTHFINCLSQDTGGEIYISEAGHAEVMKCLFTHCEASETYGGGIYAEKSQKVIATSCNFVNCISFYEGGAILVSNDIITHSISQCIFEGCQSKTGGALAIKCKESFSLFNTRFSKNSGPALHLFMDDIKAHVDIDYCCFSENTGYVHDIVSNFDTPIVLGDQNSFDTERKKAIRIDSRLNSPIDDKSFENTECQADIDPDIPQFDDGSSEYANESPYERKHKIINFGFMDFALFK